MRLQRASDASAAYNAPPRSSTRAEEGNHAEVFHRSDLHGRRTPRSAEDKASGRRQALIKAVQSLEGKLEACYYSMGDSDVIAIVEAPDAVSVAALSLAASATGLLRVKTTALLSVEEVDRALEKKHSYRGPGA